MMSEFQKEMIKILVEKFSYTELYNMKEKYLKDLTNENLDIVTRNAYDETLNCIDEALLLKRL